MNQALPSFKAYEFDADFLKRVLTSETTVDGQLCNNGCNCKCQLIGLIVSESSATVAPDGVLEAPGIPNPDLFFDKVFYRNNNFDYSDSFSSQAATNVLGVVNGKYRVVNQENEAILRQNAEFEYREGSSNGSRLHFCFFPQSPLMDIISRSKKVVFSGAEINLGHMAYPLGDEENQKIFTFKVEGDFKNDTSNLRYSTLTSRNSSGVRPGIFPQPTPFLTNVLIGQPCPPEWYQYGPTGTTAIDNIGLKWRRFIHTYPNKFSSCAFQSNS